MKNVITCVIPAYNEAPFIETVISNMPDFIKHIIVVDDASTDDTSKKVKNITDTRTILINHKTNLGVGGAVVSGYQKALALNSDIVVKVDGDGQMDLSQMNKLITPIIDGKADYTKGVRFRNVDVIKKMPFIRFLGNIGLSFLTKLASGYWNIFDPTNGYTAIHKTTLKQLKLDNLKKSYLFETDMLINLYRLRALVLDIEMTASYGKEVSGLSPFKALCTFPFFLIPEFCKRIVWQYFIMDFSALSLFLVAGIVLFGYGFIFGAYHWYLSCTTGKLATAGTVMLSAVPLILGSQLLLQAAVLDINNVPKEPTQSHTTASNNL